MSSKQSPELKKPRLTLLENNKANRLNVSTVCVCAFAILVCSFTVTITVAGGDYDLTRAIRTVH